MFLSYSDKHGTLHNRVTLIYCHRCDCAITLCLDVVLHLHCLKHNNNITSLNGITHFNVNTIDGTRQRSLDRSAATCLNWSRLYGSRSCAHNRSCNRTYDLNLWFDNSIDRTDGLFHLNLKINAVDIHLCNISLNFYNLDIIVYTLYFILILVHFCFLFFML